MNDLVSVIVPVYNAEPYVERCVASLHRQDYDQVEIILVEDGSQDESLQVCHNLTNRYDNVKVLAHKVNSGQEKARNDGIDAASGKWIMFLDADDVYSDGAIGRIMAFAQEEDFDWAFAPFTYVVKQNVRIESCGIEQGVYSSKTIAKGLLTQINNALVSCIGSKLYKKSFLDAHNIRFDLRYKYNEDGAFTLDCLKASDTVGYFNDPFYQYLVRESGSSQSSYRPDMFYRISEAHSLMKTVLEKYDSFDTQHQRYYLQHRIGLVQAALLNEVNFQDYAAFCKTVKVIRNDPDYPQMLTAIRDERTGKLGKLVLWLLKYDCCKLLFWILYYLPNRAQNLWKRLNMYKCAIVHKITGNSFVFTAERIDPHIAMFHDIVDDTTKEMDPYTCTVSQLQSYITRCQSAGVQFISIDELLQINHSGDLEKKVVITFDDGYASVMEYVEPIMTQHNIPFAVFVTSGYLNRRGYLNSKQLKKLTENRLCTIGLHSHSHGMFRYETAKTLAADYQECLEHLQANLPEGKCYYAFPYGSDYACSAKNRKQIRGYGARAIFMTHQRKLRVKDLRSPFNLPRINIPKYVQE